MVGAYTLKLAKLGPKFSKVIAVCALGLQHLQELRVATYFVHYRNGKVVEDLPTAFKDKKYYHAVDAFNNGTSWVELSDVLDQESGTSKIAMCFYHIMTTAQYPIVSLLISSSSVQSMDMKRRHRDG